MGKELTLPAWECAVYPNEWPKWLTPSTHRALSQARELGWEQCSPWYLSQIAAWLLPCTSGQEAVSLARYFNLPDLLFSRTQPYLPASPRITVPKGFETLAQRARELGWHVQEGARLSWSVGDGPVVMDYSLFLPDCWREQCDVVVRTKNKPALGNTLVYLPHISPFLLKWRN